MFKISSDGTELVLHAFGADGDGSVPLAGLIIDAQGNLYGTTSEGGSKGLGVVFKLSPNGTETILYAFKGGEDGANPVAELVADGSGNLYGTTQWGGGTGCEFNTGCGTVFKLTPDGTETVLYNFQGGVDGENPVAALIVDKSGNLYGTTQKGGGTKCINRYGCGTVFMIVPDGTETILHSFTTKKTGFYPLGGLVADGNGNLFGTASGSGNHGSGLGLVYEITPQ